MISWFIVGVLVAIGALLYGIYRRLSEIRDLLEYRETQRAPEGLSAGARVAPRPTVVAPQAPQPSPQPQAAPPAPAPQPSAAAAMVPRGFIAQATEGEPLPEPAGEPQAWKMDRIYAIVAAGIVLAGLLIALWLVSR